MIIIQFHTHCGWKRRYWSRMVCAVTIATVVPLQTEQTRSSADADKPTRRVCRSVKVTKHSTIPYVRYSFLLCNSNFVFETRCFYGIRLQKMSWP